MEFRVIIENKQGSGLIDLRTRDEEEAVFRKNYLRMMKEKVRLEVYISDWVDGYTLSYDEWKKSK